MILRLNGPHLLKNEEKIYFIPKYSPPFLYHKSRRPLPKANKYVILYPSTKGGG
jgi:hypothetical protein